MIEETIVTAITEAARGLGFEKLWLFGSALRADYHGKSDVDLMYVPGPTTPTRDDCAECFRIICGRWVDLVTRAEVEASTSGIRRRHILANNRALIP